MSGGVSITPLPPIPPEDEEEEKKPVSPARASAMKQTTLVNKPTGDIAPLSTEDKKQSTSGWDELFAKGKELVGKASKTLEDTASAVGETASKLFHQSQAGGWKEQEAITELANKLQRDTGMTYNQAKEQVMKSDWWNHLHKRESGIADLMRLNRIDRDQAEKLWKSKNDYK